MRVALISCNARQGDAIGNQVAARARWFRARGDAVHVYLQDATALHPELSAQTTVVPDHGTAGPWLDELAVMDLLCVEFGQYYPLLDYLPLLAAGKPKILLDYHGITPPQLWSQHNREALVRGEAYRGIVWLADKVIFHSRYTREELRTSCGLPAERLRQLGFPIAPPADVAVAAQQLRKRLGLEQARVLLYVGRFAPNKQVPLLIEALHQLREEKPAYYLLLVGDTTDLYQAEYEMCRQRAAELGLTARVHYLGRLFGAELQAAYRAADVLVTASQWESFCIPVVEAMAHRLPIVAARTTALPETVGKAGLTFTPGEAPDLARQVQRLFVSGSTTAAPRKVMIVTERYGEDIVSGADISLRRMAAVLAHAGTEVAVLTIGVGPAKAVVAGGLYVRRFPAASDGSSPALLRTLETELADTAAVITGPYLSRLAADVARLAGGKTLLMPCFHDEPEARQPQWLESYRAVGGFLYHSAPEEQLALAQLGFNHPNALVCGTYLEPPATHAQEPVPQHDAKRIVLYCGRYLREKNVELLLDYSQRYAAQHPERYQFVFCGEGNLTIPQQANFHNAGVCTNAERDRWLRRAAVLVQLSCRESLALVALEAWAQETPVIAHAHCTVLAEHMEQAQGGLLVDDYHSFARALDDLWDNPTEWQQAGVRGRDYVARCYQSERAFAARLQQAIANLQRPLIEQLRTQAELRAAAAQPERWSVAFAELVEDVCRRPKRKERSWLEVRRRSAHRTVKQGTSRLFIPVQLHNRGTQTVLAQGPARAVLASAVYRAGAAEPLAPPVTVTLPQPLLPGRHLAAAVPIEVPAAAGEYVAHLWAYTLPPDDSALEPQAEIPPAATVELTVTARDLAVPPGDSDLAAELADLERLQKLPDDYHDVSQGALGGLKRQLKRKLLGNFKQAYVDVLSRQQSAFNRQLLAVLHATLERCAALEHAVQQLAAHKKKKKRNRTRNRESEVHP